MIDSDKKIIKGLEKEKVRRRMRAKIDPDNYEYIPEKKKIDFYDSETHQRVAIYVRVSTDDIRQTTSYELQKKYYEDYVNKHENWTLVGIYADEGISGTSLKHRDAFNKMIQDAREGKIDLIITKSVSRFARNVMITVGITRELALLNPPVGVFFESECIFSLKEEAQMALTFQATMAEEESHTRSRSMETSLRMRLDNGIPLTPKLLGYTHDSEGNLVINEEEAPTVKLAFYMYLFGYTTTQIADVFTALSKKTYLGNTYWSSTRITSILRNERHCGDVLTRKTYTEDYRSHRVLKNNGDRPQSHYYNHHEGIVSRGDFIAVQRMLDNAKYKNKDFLPHLKVVEDGILKGFVIINPRWAGFKAEDYFRASASVETEELEPNKETICFEKGDFDLTDFEITRADFFNTRTQVLMSLYNNKINFNTVCTDTFGENTFIELLVNPIKRQFAIRKCSPENRNKIQFSKLSRGKYVPIVISAAAYSETMFNLMGWDTSTRYKVMGSIFRQDDDIACIFDVEDSAAYLDKNTMLLDSDDYPIGGEPIIKSREKICAVSDNWPNRFGIPFLVHEIDQIKNQNEEEWKLRLEGRLFSTGDTLDITGFDEIKEFIKTELKDLINLEEESATDYDQQ